MKTGIHPNLKLAKVICTGCGNEFETLSVKETITVSICSNCHPFFTGTKKLLDTEGRVQKFERRYNQQSGQQQNKKREEQQAKIAAKLKKKA